MREVIVRVTSGGDNGNAVLLSDVHYNIGSMKQMLQVKFHRNRVDVSQLRKDARGVSSELGIGRSRRAALLRAGGGSWGPLGAICAGFRWFPGSARAPF